MEDADRGKCLVQGVGFDEKEVLAGRRDRLGVEKGRVD